MRQIVNVVVISLLLLVGLAVLLSALLRVRGPAARTQCQWNLAQIGQGLAKFHLEHEAFPYGTVPVIELPPEQRLSWYVPLLPFALPDSPAAKFDRVKGWAAPDNQEAVTTPIRAFLCPAVLEKGPLPVGHITHYVGMAGLGPDAATLPSGDRRAGCFGYDRRTTIAELHDSDGASQTIIVVETGWLNGPWAAGGPPTLRGVDPANRPQLGMGRPFGGLHLADGAAETVVLILFADGAVRPFVESVNPRILEAFATIAGDDEVFDER